MSDPFPRVRRAPLGDAASPARTPPGRGRLSGTGHRRPSSFQHLPAPPGPARVALRRRLQGAGNAAALGPAEALGQRVPVPRRESRPRGRRGGAAAPTARPSAKSYRRGPRLPAMRGRRPPWRRCPSRGQEGRPGPALLPALFPALFPAPRLSCCDVTRARVTCRRRPPRSAPAGPAGCEGSGPRCGPTARESPAPGAPAHAAPASLTEPLPAARPPSAQPAAAEQN